MHSMSIAGSLMLVVLEGAVDLVARLRQSNASIDRFYLSSCRVRTLAATAETPSIVST